MKIIEKETTVQTVYGAKAIGKVIDEPNTRIVYYMLDTGQIPGASQPPNSRKWRLSIPVWRRAVHGPEA